MKTLHETINDCMDGFQPEPLDAYYAILALSRLLTLEHQAHWQIAQSNIKGKPLSTVAARKHLEASLTRLQISGKSHPKEVLGAANDPQTPEFQERRRKAKADAEAKKLAGAVNNRA